MKPTSSPGFPGAHAVSLHGCPCFGGTHSAQLPTGSVSSARSRLRVERGRGAIVPSPGCPCEWTSPTVISCSRRGRPRDRITVRCDYTLQRLPA
jgi:hypothetical protein